MLVKHSPNIIDSTVWVPRRRGFLPWFTWWSSTSGLESLRFKNNSRYREDTTFPSGVSTIHSPVFIIVDLCINILKGNWAFCLERNILPRPPLLKLQKAFQRPNRWRDRGREERREQWERERKCGCYNWSFHKSKVLIGAHAILLGKERPEPMLRSDLIGCRQGGGQTLRAE